MKCKICKKEMSKAKGCIDNPFILDDKEYARIKVGDTGDFYEHKEDAVCNECGAHYGHPHHLGCDCERCPVCGMQLISCDCNLFIETE